MFKLTCIFFSLLYSATALAWPELSLSDAAGAPGRTVTITIGYVGDGTVAGMDFVVNYDPNLLTPGFVKSGIPAPYTVSANVIATGRLKVLVAPILGELMPAIPSSNSLATIPFTIATNASEEPQPLTITDVVMGDATAKTITPTNTAPGHITIIPLAAMPVRALPKHAPLRAHATSASVCPVPVGDDITDCGSIITVTDAGSTITFTGQGTYDGNDDTLIGVIDNSSQPIYSLGLMSIGGALVDTPLFGFDGDGIVTYGVPGNPKDDTGYGGPNAYYDHISSDLTSGVVHFITPIAAKGGTSYFALESALDTAISCADVINNSITNPPILDRPNSGDGGFTRIKAVFTPNKGLSTKDAATYCGFTKFNWIQKVTHLPSPSPFYTINPVDPSNKSKDIQMVAPPEFNDPPQNQYRYLYDSGDTVSPYPFYWDDPAELAIEDNGTTLSFEDAPADPCLPGGSGKGCNGQTAPAGEYVGFTTHLAGVLPDGSAVDLGIGFSWKSTYNGTAGGIATTKNVVPVDPGGTGGNVVTSVQTTTNYNYNGAVITSVNGVPVSPVVVSCDANGDTKINSLDMIVTINQILGIATASGKPDCNQNGNVDSLDLVGIVKIILGIP